MAVAIAVLCMSIREVVLEGGFSSPEPCTLRSVQVRTVLCPVNYLFYKERLLVEAEVQLDGSEATVTARPFRLACPSALLSGEEGAAEAAAEALRSRNASAAGLQCYVFDANPGAVKLNPGLPQMRSDYIHILVAGPLLLFAGFCIAPSLLEAFRELPEQSGAGSERTTSKREARPSMAKGKALLDDELFFPDAEAAAAVVPGPPTVAVAVEGRGAEGVARQQAPLYGPGPASARASGTGRSTSLHALVDGAGGTPDSRFQSLDTGLSPRGRLPLAMAPQGHIQVGSCNADGSGQSGLKREEV
jgi:hypothetical protein